jgi:hypothetical protein
MGCDMLWMLPLFCSGRAARAIVGCEGC